MFALTLVLFDVYVNSRRRGAVQSLLVMLLHHQVVEVEVEEVGGERMPTNH